MKKPIPIGYEDFKQVIDEDAYYVDKPGMIKELLDSAVSVSLFTRPRRFGKTLNLSMIQSFFEDERDRDGEPINNKSLFTGLQIIKQGQRYLRHQQQYPVIHLSLKSARQPDFHLAYAMLKQQIIEEYSRHQYILNDLVLTNAEKKRYTAILNGANEPSLYLDALAFLSKCLAIYHQQKALVLIDEYDVPLENAWFEGFYEEMSTFVRSLFESVLKTNPHLKFAVITGCLRISREIIFTGLNNLRIYSVMETRYAECFGFTVSEVKKMLSYGFLAGLLKALKKYRVFSNRESGTGRPDILMKTPFIRNGTAVIFEIKAADTYQTLKTSCERALQQIREQNYEAAVRMEGYEAVRKYGIAFYKKECMVLEG